MKRSVVSVAVAVLALVAGLIGAGIAAASGPNVVGSTYAKAAEKISNWGYTPVIASVVGDQLPTDDCIVTSSAQASNLDSSGRSRGKQLLVNLNCNAGLAGPGKPGNSLATPEGQKVRAIQLKGEGISMDYTKALQRNKAPWCEANAQRCQEICQQAGTCSADLLKYLGVA
ncbi:conserved exported hypothetical protein [uncultured Mycobacterium sp.]|uniref:Uncharacterized protein n=1 Tax=uncultured Mycobacterium sp. TaxID=171292 RepID=A0A1Y5P852_9MYCO|nr:conserved exported hypothetical protein [uncultured Mycobacterium sp.]